MKIDDARAVMPAPGGQDAADVFQQVGAITRALHDALRQLGVMPQLQQIADGIPDARSRLSYIASKTASAAEKVLNSVDGAKAEHGLIIEHAQALEARLRVDAQQALAHAEVLSFIDGVLARAQRIDAHLTDIMLAQDFHDLTGQVVGRVLAMASELERSLVKLLVQVAPPGQRERRATESLSGPVVDEGRADVVKNQSEVDDLLASLGF